MPARRATGPCRGRARTHPCGARNGAPAGWLRLGPGSADDRISLAVVGLASDGSPDYGFHVQGAADWQWTDDELAAAPAGAVILRVGSISSWTPPGCAANARLVRTVGRAGNLVSVDPNIRPMLAGGAIGVALGNTPDAVRRRVAALVAEADVVKVSAEDLAWLEPGVTDLDDAAARWVNCGPEVVLLTDGGRPLRVARPGRPVLRRQPPRVAVVDTVGAGDALAAGLFAGLLASGVTAPTTLAALTDDQLIALVDDAALVAALTSTRVGADPPTRAEWEANRGRAGW